MFRDHLQSNTWETAAPIYVDIRPWGSACTIIAHTFMRERRLPSKPVAGMLLSGILSDTLNLKSPTTTPTDRVVMATLAELAGDGDGPIDVDRLAQEQFKAKSEIYRVRERVGERVMERVRVKETS